MAILFALGAMGGFGLAQRDSFESQSHGKFGTRIGEARTVQITAADRAGYAGFGIVCAVGCVYFLTRIGEDDSRK